MKILLSPTKKQKIYSDYIETSDPYFKEIASKIHADLVRLDGESLKKILKISDKLLDINLKRISDWSIAPADGEYSPAIYTFIGEVFSYLKPELFDKETLNYANEKLLIFSGLYGLLKPLDRIMPYRLDVNDPLKINNRESLNSLWREPITDYLKSETLRTDDNIILDLSSQEYSKLINFNSLDSNIIKPEFKTLSNGKLKTVAIWSKRMRGQLAREVIINRVNNISDFQKIELEEYTLKDIDNNRYLYIKEK